MQVTRGQNQPNFGARVVNEKQVIKKVRAQKPDALGVLREQITLMKKIGSNKTTEHYIGYFGEKVDTPFCRKGRPFMVETQVLIPNTKQFSTTNGKQFNLTVEQLAEKAQENVNEALKHADSHAEQIINGKPQKGLISRFLGLFS